jgi:hypothetical protein
MSSLFRRRVVSRRGIVFFSLALASAASIAARPAAPGLTYRVRMVVTPPEIPGMPPQSPTVITGRGASVGTQSRLDIDSVQGQVPLAIGDYMLTLDSGKTFMVNPASKTYTEGMPGMASLPPEILAQASVTNVNVTTERLGAGERMQGFATEKVRMTVTYSLAIMGQAMNTMTTAEMWVAKLPAAVATPFDGSLPKQMTEGPMKELAEKAMAARKSIDGTPIKTITTAQITGPMSITTVTTVELLDIKQGDVDAAMLKVPEGFTKRP